MSKARDGAGQYVSSFRTDKVAPDWKLSVARTMITDVVVLEALKTKYTGLAVAFDTETDGLDHEVVNIIGFSLCWNLEETFYIPLRHRFGTNINDPEKALQILYEILYSSIVVLVYNWHFDGHVISKHGADRNRIKHLDVMAIVWNTDTNVAMPSLKGSAERLLGIKSGTFEDLVGGKKGSYENLDPLDCLDYAAGDAYLTMALAKHLRQFYIDNKFIVDLDNHFIKALMDLSDTPLRVDKPLAEKFLIDAEIELKRLETAIQEAFGKVFNIRSTQQLGRVLEENGLDTGKRTETGKMSVGMEQLGNVTGKHPAVPLLIQFASLTKHVGSYLVPTNEHYREDLQGFRINYYTCKAPTARVSSGTGADPQRYYAKVNIQAIPKGDGCKYRTEYTNLEDPQAVWGWRFIQDDKGDFEGQSPDMNVRSVYLPHPNHYVLDIDYDGEELVVAGNISGDPAYLEPLAAGEDLHKAMALMMWGKEAYTKALRQKAKIGNFNLVYGGYAKSLQSKMPGVTLEEMEELYEKWWSVHAVLRGYQTAMQQQAKKDGFFKTRMGRIRRVDFWYKSPDRGLRAFADRTVSNGLVQGLCGDIIRFAITRVWNDVIREPRWFNKHVFWMCTVHDELVLSVDKSPDLFAEISSAVLHRMLDFGFLQFKVPLTASPAAGLNWGSCFDFHQDEKGVWVPGKKPRPTPVVAA